MKFKITANRIKWNGKFGDFYHDDEWETFNPQKFEITIKNPHYETEDLILFLEN